MRRALAGCVAAVCTVLMSAAASAADEPSTRVVDDDHAQCPDAAFRTIGDAVAAADPGDTVAVCPGAYRERVVVDKPLRLLGAPDVVSRLDCFDPTWRSSDPTDPTVLPVIAPPDAEPGSLLRMQADGVEVTGIVFQGQRESTLGTTTFAPAVQADGAYSGHRIHANLIQDNTFGIELGSSGTTLSRADHNCLRGNDWGLANQRYPTASVRVDDNDAFRTRVIPFEVGTYAAGLRDARFDHNRSVESGFAAFFVERAESASIDHNSIEAPGNGGSGVYLRGGNRDVQIRGNRLVGAATASTGITISAPVAAAPAPSTGVVAAGNTVEGFTVGILLAANAQTDDARILQNVTLANRLAGIQVGPTNTSALVQANVSDNNAYGIRTANAQVTGNTFVGNSMHANGVDAAESSFGNNGGLITLNNTWRRNACDKDSPPGAICTG